MKLKLTWDTNPDGARRALMQGDGHLRLWAIVKDEKDDPLGGDCQLFASIRPTGLIHWLHRAGPRWRSAPKASQQRLQVKRVSDGRAEFLVAGKTDLCLPYWVVLRARRSETEEEGAKVFVVPRANRLLSLAFVGVFGVMLSYLSWLWLSVASETVPEGLSTIFVTASAVLAPFAAFVSPLVSATVRRFALDALVSGASALAAVAGVLWLHGWQSPVLLENYTPTEINVPGSPGRQIVVPPGQGLVVPRSHLDAGWLSVARGGKRDPKKVKDWFGDGQYCVRREPTEPSGEAPAECLELRAISLSGKLQRWFAFGETIRVGCESVVGLDADVIDAWRASNSCRRNPELEVKRTLPEHRRLTMDAADYKVAPPCTAPSGTVAVRPFAAAPTKTKTDTSSPFRLQQIDLTLPAATLPGETLPSWTSKGEGPLAEVRLVPSTDDLGGPCVTPYPRPCEDDRSKTCNGLQLPPGALTTTISLGDQKLGALACPNPPGRVFATRLRSKIVALTVLEKFEQDGRALVRQVSRYEVENSELPSAWVFWCEPANKSSSNAKSPPPALSAEVVLPKDWQPLEEWKVRVPTDSRITSLDISVQEQGRWGTLSCPDRRGERQLGLKELKNTRNARLASAVGRAAADPHHASGWYGYGESTLFPRWAWRCEDDSGGLIDDPLTAELDDGTRGTLTGSGSFSPSPGAPCLIDPRSGEKVPGRASKGKPAAELLKKYGVAGCDPKRSRLIALGGTRQ